MVRTTVGPPRLLAFLCLSLAAFLGAAAFITNACGADATPTPLAKVSIAISLDHADALYALGEPAVFTIKVQADEKPVTDGTLEAVITFDQLKVIKRVPLPLGEEEYRLSETLATPGFLHCMVNYRRGHDMKQGSAAAGYEPQRIEATTQMPEDFAAFWEAGTKALAVIPLDLREEKIPAYDNAKHTASIISVANLDGRRSWALVTVPLSPGPHPIIIMVPGANPLAPQFPLMEYASRAITVHISVHPYHPLAALKDDSLLKPYNWYPMHGAPDREHYYFYYAILGASRLIDWAAARPEYDQKHMVISGGSQGGAFALFMTGLNPHITAAAADKPALCDHSAYTAGRRPSWPGLVPQNLPEQQEAYLNMSRYFDGVNFARRITVPTLFAVGFLDSVCPPGTVYAAYNSVPGEKKMLHGIPYGHFFNIKEHNEFRDRWIAGELGLGPRVPLN